VLTLNYLTIELCRAMKLAIRRIFQKTGAAGNSWPSYLERLKPENGVLRIVRVIPWIGKRDPVAPESVSEARPLGRATLASTLDSRTLATDVVLIPIGESLA
jgi:hypothetical protein